ncbi:MAG: RNA methyltransferase [Pseudobdellovibrionaceae bacterium]
MLSAEDLSILKSCYELMREMEKSFQQGPFSEKDLHQLAGLLRSFSLSDQVELGKLSLIPEHLHPQMSLRHFLNFLVPVERLLGRNLSDDSFLVTSQDRKSSVTEKIPLYFVLENIRSAFNVGSIFRLADCLAVEEIFLCGYTPTPEQEALQKTSLGTSEKTKWSHRDNLSEALKELQKRKVQLVALETAENSTSLFDFRLQGPTAFVVGNERFGLEASALQQCDLVLSIPTFGSKNSLNVSNALSIAAYEWRRQWK